MQTRDIAMLRSISLGIGLWLILAVFMAIGSPIAAQMPNPNEWTEHGTVIPRGSNGSWDDTDVRTGCAIIFRDSIFVYYVGADHQRPDGDAGNMAIGLAKSADGVNFTKYSGNPLFTFRPNGDAEECAEFPVAAVDATGKIWMYWGGNTSIGSGLVRCDIYLSTSTDGHHWTSGTKVIDYHNIGSGGGDEIWPIGLLHAQGGTASGTGNWHLWICGDRTPTAYSAKLAVSTNGTTWNEQDESPVLTDYLWQEGVCPILHEDGSVTIFDFCGCATGSGREIRLRTTHRNSLHSYSSVLGSFNDDPWWPGTVAVIADTSAGLWRMYWAKRSADIGGVINMKTAPLQLSGVNHAPTAIFSANPTSGVAPLTVSFNASASTDPDGDDLSYAWTVKKGTSTVATGSGVSWQYVFNAAGDYTTYLVVADDGEPALSDTTWRTIQISDQLPPTASFTADPMSGTFPFPLQVDFDASASTDPDGFIVSYHWDFGDGSDTTLAGPYISHTYLTPGQGALVVTLTVTDDDGATDSATKSLDLYQEGQELEVSNLSKLNYQTAYLEVGGQYYVDRTYTLQNVPQQYQGLLWIKTANDDKTNSSESFLSFTVNQDVTAYVAYDHRASSLPSWITNFFTQTGGGIGVSDTDASPLMLWSRSFPAGMITMGGNMASGSSGAGSMYVILLRGHGPTDTSAPSISGIMATGISSAQATIQWTTDEASNSQVDYGLTAAYGQTTPLEATLVTQHSVVLSDLSAGTLYHYRVRSADGAGNVAYSEDQTFQTVPLGDIIPPAISNVGVSDTSDAQATINWTTDEPSDSRVEYGLTAAYGQMTPLDPDLVLQHGMTLSGLSAETLYHYRVRSADGSGNVAFSGDQTFRTRAPSDLTPPQISDLAIADLSDTLATVAWFTDEPANSQVEYGLTPSYGQVTSLEAALVMQHSVLLSGLSAGTLYHYRVRSADGAGNVAYSEDQTFQTVASGDVTPPLLLEIDVPVIGDTMAAVAWSTDELADSQVEWGLVPGSGLWTVADSNLVFSHRLDLMSLEPDTRYYFRVRSCDPWGNASTSEDSSFVTGNRLPGMPGKPWHTDD